MSNIYPSNVNFPCYLYDLIPVQHREWYLDQCSVLLLFILKILNSGWNSI